MSRTHISLYLALILLLPLTGSTILAGEDASQIMPGTPEAVRAIAELGHAEHLDRMQAQSYTSGDDSEVGVFYYQKAEEAKALSDQLRSKQPISTGDLQRALDTSKAAHYIGGD